MKKNIGRIEVVFRIAVGLLLISLVFIGPKTSWGWLGIVLLITALFRYCP